MYSHKHGLEATGLKTKTIVHKSAAPIYAAAVTWVLYALLFPLYQVGHFLLAAAASAVVALIARMFCRDVTETVEVPEEPVSTGNGGPPDPGRKDGDYGHSEPQGRVPAEGIREPCGTDAAQQRGQHLPISGQAEQQVKKGARGRPFLLSNIDRKTEML